MAEYDRIQKKQESRAIANSRTDGYCKKQKISIIDRRNSMKQLKPAHDTSKYSECFDRTDEVKRADLLEIAAQGNVYKKTLPDTFDTRVQALTAISAQAANVGNKVVKGGYENPPETDTEKIAPFLYDVTTFHNEDTVGTEGRKLTTRYQMANQRNGYIVYIKDGVLSAKIGKKKALGTHKGHYSTDHEKTADYKVSDYLNDANKDGTISENICWDAYSKLAGEGARFQCVKNHISDITDNTTFGINEKGGQGIEKPNVTFSTLWKSWSKVFESAFNIPDSTVAEKISKRQNFVAKNDIRPSSVRETNITVSK